MMQSSGAFTTRSATLRDTAKWIAAGFTGAGAVLFSGLTYSNIQSQTAAPLWWLQLALSVVPLVAAAWALREAAFIAALPPPDVTPLLPRFEAARRGEILQDAPGLDAASNSLRDAVDRLAPSPVIIYGSVEKFDLRISGASLSAGEAANLYKLEQTTDRWVEAEKAFAVVNAMESGVQDIISAADFHATEKAYRNARLKFLAAAALAVGAMIGVGAINAATRPEETTAAATVSEPTAVHLFLKEEKAFELVARDPQHPEGCPIWDDMSATAIGGTLDEPLLVFDGKSLVGANVAIGADLRKACADGWLWRADKALVTVVPR